MPQIDFDLVGARQHGYTDDQIADALAKRSNFDAAGARQHGFTSQQIIQRLASPASIQKAAVSTALDKEAQDTGVGEAILVGAGHTFDRIGKGMQQGWYALTGDDKAAAKLKQEAADDEEIYQHLHNAHPVASGVGEALPAMAVPVGGGAATAMQAAVRMGVAAGGIKAMEYGTPEERAKDAAITGGTTMAGGVIIPKVAQAAVPVAKAALKSIAGKITPEAMALYDKAKQLGIPVNVAQLSDSKFLKTLSSTLEQIPFTGAAKWIGDQREAFTNAVSKTFGEDTKRITPEVYAAAKKRLGDTFNDLTKRNTLKIDTPVRQSLEAIQKDAANTAEDGTRAAIDNIMGRIDGQGSTTGGNIPATTSPIVGANGQPIITAPASSTPAITQVPGSLYQSIDTELGNMIKAGGEKGQYAKRLQMVLRDGMDQSISGADKDAWMTARSQYRNLKAVRDIVAKNAADGQIPPTALSNALNSTEAGKEAMAMGARGTLGDLGQIGRQFVRDQAPDSRTALRQIAFGIAGGGAAAGMTGMTTIGSLALGGATTGRLIQKLLANPKTVDALRRQGISMADLAKMPPNKIVQLVGGSLGNAEADQMEK